MKEKFDIHTYHETRIALLENSVAHISDTLKDIKQDIHSLRVELKIDIQGLRTELKSDINGLRVELNKKIDAVALNANSQFKWLMGTFISFQFTFLTVLLTKVLH